VLVAPPGAGKTTRVPPAVASMPELAGRVVVLEPRRIAALAAARRVSQEIGEPVGGAIGYQVRFERKWRERSRVVFVTEGILVRWMQEEPLLDAIGCVIFDELHERSLHTDLALAMTLRLRREVRPDLRLLAMSATLDTERVAAYLGGVPVVRSAGRLYPVDVRLLPRADTRPLPAQAAAAIRTARRESEGVVLAFLPGKGEIEATARLLAGEGMGGNDAPVVPLHGELPLARQAAALRGEGLAGSSRRVVLATDVAETSVTVEDVTAVIDSGWRRAPRFDPATGLDRLELQRVSRASADQRAGRAGRTAPGVCLRLWTPATQASLLPSDVPEILRVDLSATVLQIRAWGERPEHLAWLDSPRPAQLAVAIELLRQLGALEGPSDAVTPLGRELARLPLPPRLSRLVVETARRAAIDASSLDEGALVAALLAERGAARRPTREEAAGLADSDSDVLDAWRALRAFARDPRSGAAHVHAPAARRVHDAARQIGRLVRESALEGSAGSPRLRAGRDAGKLPPPEPVEVVLRRALLAGFPDRVARRRADDPERAVMVGGRGVRAGPTTLVRRAPLFVCVEVQGAGRDATVHQASAIESEWLDPAALRIEDAVELDERTGRVVARRRSLYRDLILEEALLPRPDPERAAELLVTHATRDPRSALGLDREPLRSLLARIECLREHRPDLELPSLDDEATLAELVAEAARGRVTLAQLHEAPVRELLRDRLSWRQLQALDELVPERIRLPSGRTAAIRYEIGKPPVLAARIQDLYGWRDTPRIAGGKLPLLLHLLAPSSRPQQITDDLRGFWQRTYPQVRKELAGRYPKHAWPDDPSAASAAPARRR
jgi:ATP-dependent helicase HrpB